MTVLRSTIAEIDLEGRSITIEPGDFTENLRIEFEHLVLTLGGIVDLSRVPGMPEHALLMKNVGDALRLRDLRHRSFRGGHSAGGRRGTEPVAHFRHRGRRVLRGRDRGQLLDFTREMALSYARIHPKQVRVVLVHSGAHLLPEISASLGRYTEETLLKRGMEIMLNARVSSITASRVVLQDGRTLESHTVVSTVGNAPHPLLTALAKKNNLQIEKGRLVTDPFMRVLGQERLWTAGDGSAVPMPPQAEDGKHGFPFRSTSILPSHGPVRQSAGRAHGQECSGGFDG